MRESQLHAIQISGHATFQQSGLLPWVTELTSEHVTINGQEDPVVCEILNRAHYRSSLNRLTTASLQEKLVQLFATQQAKKIVPSLEQQLLLQQDFIKDVPLVGDSSYKEFGFDRGPIAQSGMSIVSSQQISSSKSSEDASSAEDAPGAVEISGIYIVVPQNCIAPSHASSAGSNGDAGGEKGGGGDSSTSSMSSVAFSQSEVSSTFLSTSGCLGSSNLVHKYNEHDLSVHLIAIRELNIGDIVLSSDGISVSKETIIFNSCRPIESLVLVSIISKCYAENLGSFSLQSFAIIL
jgi:hypothetical protein